MKKVLVRWSFLLTVCAVFGLCGCSGNVQAATVTPLKITWSTPASIAYGTALSSTQLNATANVAGTFSYSPASGTVLPIGSNTLTATFTPTDKTRYRTTTATVVQTVTKSTLAITWSTPTAITYGTALSSTQLNATANIPGTFVYSPASGTVLTAGTQTLTATFTPTDTTNYSAKTATASLTVNKANPTISWATPTEITYGTGLSATQLDAISSVAGTFSYLPAARAILGAGTRTLSTTFTPTDTTNYNTTTATTSLTITLPTTPIAPTMPTTVCTAPTAITSPSTSLVVGSGSASSCTEAALQTAITSAINTSGGAYITFNCGGSATIAITTGLEVPYVYPGSNPVVIDGGSNITLDGKGVTRIVQVDGFVQQASFRNLTFINGYGGESSDAGPTGYISTEFYNTSGGAIRGNYGNTIEVINSVFQDNTALFGSGGAIFANSGNVLKVSGSVFNNNKGGYGSGIFGMAAGVHLYNSTFTNNGIAETSDDASTWYPIYGGAVNVDGTGTDGTFTTCGSDFENNVSPASGGALSLWFYAPDVVTIDSSTFKNNIVWATPNTSEAGIANGGAANIGMGYSTTSGVVGTMVVKNSTFMNNVAKGSLGTAGGVALFSDGGSTSAYNNTFYENTAATGADMSFGGWASGASGWSSPTPYIYLTNDTFAYGLGSTTSLSLAGYNYIINDSVFLENGAAICNFTGTGSNDLQYSSSGSTTSCISSSVLSANPLLAAPANNGGSTLTMLPATASPLVGAGTSCESTDQRGVTRNTSACTIGAVEVQ